MGCERFNIRQFLIITSSHAHFASLPELCRILLITVGRDPGVLRELGAVKNGTATGQRVHLNRTCGRVRGAVLVRIIGYRRYKQSDTDDLRRHFDMHDSTRGRGRTRPEYLVNKRRPIETKVPGVRVVTSVQLFSIRHY